MAGASGSLLGAPAWQLQRRFIDRPSERLAPFPALLTALPGCSASTVGCDGLSAAATVSHWLRLSPVAGSGGAERALRCQLLWLTLAGGAAPYCSRSRGLLGQCHGEGSEHAVSLKDHRPVVSSSTGHGSSQHMKRVHRTYGGSAAPRPLF